MKEIIYAGGSFVTGDEIADALLDTAAALAEASLAEDIEVPVLAADGQREIASFLIGPSSQIVAHPVASEAAELRDEVAVARLHAVARRMRPSAVVTEEPDPDAIDPDIPID